MLKTFSYIVAGHPKSISGGFFQTIHRVRRKIILKCFPVCYNKWLTDSVNFKMIIHESLENVSVEERIFISHDQRPHERFPSRSSTQIETVTAEQRAFQHTSILRLFNRMSWDTLCVIHFQNCLWHHFPPSKMEDFLN